MMKKRILFVLSIMALTAVCLFAATDSSMPWDGLLTKIQNALAGTTVKVVAGIMIIIGGVMVALMEGQGIKKLLWILIGIGIAVGASSFAMNMFGISTGFLVK